MFSVSSLNPRPKGRLLAVLSRFGRHLPLARSLVDGRDVEWAAQPSMQSGTAENIFLNLRLFYAMVYGCLRKGAFCFFTAKSVTAERLKGALKQ